MPWWKLSKRSKSARVANSPVVSARRSLSLPSELPTVPYDLGNKGGTTPTTVTEDKSKSAHQRALTEPAFPSQPQLLSESPPVKPPLDVNQRGDALPVPGVPTPPITPIGLLQSEGITADVYAGPKTTKTEKILDKMGKYASVSLTVSIYRYADIVQSSGERNTHAQDPNNLVNSGLNVVKQIVTAEVIETAVKSFMDDIPWLLKGLDEVSKVHPFVRGAQSSL